MNFQRILLLLVVLLAAGLAGAFYMNWKTLGQLRTVKAFVEGQVLADAVAACERAQSTTPFKWTGARQTAVIGVNSVKLNKDTIIPATRWSPTASIATMIPSRRRPISARTSWSGNRFCRCTAREH